MTTRSDTDTTPVPAAEQPRGPSVATFGGILIGLLLLALGVLAIREAVLTWGAFGGRPELDVVTDQVDGRAFETWMWAVAAGLLLLAVLMLVAVFGRRARPAYRLRAGTGVFVRRADAARLAEHTALGVPGVLAAAAKPGRKVLRVSISTTGAPDTPAEVEQVLTERLAALDPCPAIRVRAGSVGRADAGQGRA